MDVVEDAGGEGTLVRPDARLDHSTAAGLEETLERLFRETGRRVVVDLRGVHAISSAGIGALVKGAKLAQAAGGRMSLCGLTGPVEKVFKVTNVLQLFEVHPTSDEALHAMGAAASARPARPRSAARPVDATVTFTVPEELVLLAVVDEDGRIVDLPDDDLAHALAGGVLMELCLRGRVDVDLEQLSVVDRTPLGDDVLDPVLRTIAESPAVASARGWIEQLARSAAPIRQRMLARLIERGILPHDTGRLRRVLGRRRDAVVDDRPRREVRERILGVVRSGEIPTPRDVAIVGLAEACGVFDALLDEQELAAARPRILEISGMDLLVQSMVEALLSVRREPSGEEPCETDTYT